MRDRTIIPKHYNTASLKRFQAKIGYSTMQKYKATKPEKTNPTPCATALSGRMFWDTPVSNIHWYEHRHFIVQRVMRYGKLEDWKLIQQWYGSDTLREIVVSLNNLDAISVAFLSLVLNIDKKAFRCYTEKQSRQNFWDY